MLRAIALLVGPALAAALLFMPPPEGLSGQGLAVGAVAVLMAVWWMSEAIPLAVTALLPLVLFPPLGIASVDVTARAYAHPLIFLFLGGFMMARAMQRWNLNRRVALGILRLCSDRPAGIIAGVMIATAFLSMWVSNTATAMMMLPIGQAIIVMVGRAAGGKAREADVATFATALMLGIAYAATIGGMATLIGTPPNALFAGFMAESFTIEISFLGWMLVGVPVAVILLPIAWLVLTRIAFTLSPSLPALKDARIEKGVGELGPMGTGEKRVAVLLAIAAAGWVFRPLIQAAAPELALSDAGIAVTVTMMLFITPSDRLEGSFLRFGKKETWQGLARTNEFLLTWNEAKEIRWDVLILFGGGLALANMIGASGLAAWIAVTSAALGGLPWLLLILVVAAIIVLLGELASNTAMAAVFLPVAAAAAFGLGIHPGLLAMTVALSASLGFMLPVATPPNAIVYGSGAVPAPDMVRAGAILDAAGVAVVALVVLTIGRWLFGG